MAKCQTKKEVKEAKTPVKKTTKKISKKKDSKSAKKVEKSKKEDNEITNVNVKETSTEEVTPKDNHKSIKSKDNLGNDDFDWTTVEDSSVNNELNKDEESMYTSTMPVIEEKQVLDGKVVNISDREVIVDINFKSDGVVSSSEFKYNEDLKIGDEVEILVEKQEDKNGQLVLSHRRARVLRAWEKVNVALETGEVVQGKIKSRTKGGMIAEVFGIEAFLPGSQIDVKPIRDYDEYVGRDMEFKVVKVNDVYRNIVVSHKRSN